MDGEDVPKVKQENRLPYEDPKQWMDQYGYTYCAVWRELGLTKHDKQRDAPLPNGPPQGKPCVCLTLDAHSSIGPFASSFAGWEISAKGATAGKEDDLKPGLALPWRCFKSETTLMVEHVEDMISSDDPRKEVAKSNKVKGAFAIFRDGAVYEFGGPKEMPTPPDEFISSIGGSTGVNAAAKAVLAVVKLKSKSRLANSGGK
jgi:hypothetical protein